MAFKHDGKFKGGLPAVTHDHETGVKVHAPGPKQLRQFADNNRMDLANRNLGKTNINKFEGNRRSELVASGHTLRSARTQAKAEATVDLSGLKVDAHARFYDVREGRLLSPQCVGGGSQPTVRTPKTPAELGIGPR